MITAEDVEGELNNTGKMYRNGFDKYDRPVLYMKPRNDNTNNQDHRENKVRYLVYLLEKCTLAANTRKREKITIVVDFKDANLMAGGMSGMKTSKEILNILQDYYPETLGCAFILNAPWTFSAFWSVISPFLHPITHSKIRFVKKTDELLQIIEKKELEVEYGGDNNFKYDFETHFKKEDNEFPPYAEI
eukprot:TRINITY_DN1627_c0_g1_i1.p1 TRINITY_DN1627_c0_g1~~TRINITY_DN1627_c0_g1_i1.p1  ORF type:complete len:189 (+),score=48.54 TRINITY_DN1627_c0_g1_i1:342-908(+)